MAAATSTTMTDIRHLQIPVSANPMSNDTREVAEEIVRGYLNKGWTLFDVTISNINIEGFFAVYTLVR